MHRLRSGAARGKPPWPGVTEEGAHETASRGTCLGYQPSQTEGTPNVCWLPSGPHVLWIWTELSRWSQESELLFARTPFSSSFRVVSHPEHQLRSSRSFSQGSREDGVEGGPDFRP